MASDKLDRPLVSLILSSMAVRSFSLAAVSGEDILIVENNCRMKNRRINVAKKLWMRMEEKENIARCM